MTVKELRQLLFSYDSDMQIDVFEDDDWPIVDEFIPSYLREVDGRLVLNTRTWPSNNDIASWLDDALGRYRNEAKVRKLTSPAYSHTYKG